MTKEEKHTMVMHMDLAVHDFKRAFKVLVVYCLISILFLPLIILAPLIFFIAYTPLKVKSGKVSFPANDQIRTFLDIIFINPLTGYFRRRSYYTDEILSVNNGYTRPIAGNKGRNWNVVLSGITRKGESFSQKIDCSSKQTRDEVRTVLKQVIKGRVGSDFSY